MKNKTPLILGGAFLLLLVIFFVTSFHPREKTRGAEPLFKGEKPAIDKIEVINPRGESVTLEKQNDVWNITKPIVYKASAQVIDEVLNGLQEVMVDGVVTSDVSQQKAFGVVDSTAANIRMYSKGKTVLDVLIGRFTPDLSHTYMRDRGSKDITMWRGIFPRMINRELDNWRDRAIFSFNPEDVVSLKAVSGKTTRQLTLTDSTWTFTENGKVLPIEQPMAKQMAGMIGNLSCDAFASEDDIPRAASTAPDTQVSFTVRNGDTHSFELWSPGPQDNGRYLVRTPGMQMLFRFMDFRGSFLALSYDKVKPGSQEALQQQLQQMQQQQQQQRQMMRQ